MHLHRCSGAAEFRRDAEPYLVRHEALHGLLLGLIGGLRQLPQGALAGVLRDDGGDVVAAVVLRLDTRLIVSRVESDQALHHLAAALAREPLTAILGDPRAVKFVAAAMDRPVVRSLPQGVYTNRRVIWPAQRPPGVRRLAGPDDAAELATWHLALSESIGARTGIEQARVSVDERIATSALHVWDDGRLVSSAAAVGATSHGIRINLVYTPPPLRGRGYASSLVAELTQALLDQGREFVFLHTDLANPTSNALYLRLGYERVGDFLMLELGAPSAVARDSES